MSQSPFPAYTSVPLPFRVVAEGLAFPEGPLELPGGDLAVVEIRTGVVTRLARDGSRATIAETGGGPNGAALGPDGAIYVTQNGGFSWHERTIGTDTYVLPGEQPDTYSGGQIQRVTLAGEVTTLYRECDGRPLRGPNDLVFDADGNFYFTDLGKTRARDHDRGGVFFATSDGRTIREIVFPLDSPNGIGLSPDGRELYVAETSTARVWAFPLAGPGQVTGRRYVTTVPGVPPAAPAMLDSLCVDRDGNVVVATLLHGGITSVSPDGRSLAHTPLPDLLVTNACFGGSDLRTLYVTLSGTGRVVAIDRWPTAGHKLNFQT